MPRIIVLAIVILLTGCTSYRYEITSPDGGTAQVLKDRDLVIPAAPARLRLRQVESRCVVLVDNPTTQPMTLDGNNSTIVDPKGQSRAVASQLIAGGSFIKFILPPMREDDPQGPTVHFGVGFLVDGEQSREAKYLEVNPPGQEYWEWSGTGSVQLILTLKQGDENARQTFTITRSEK